jgi:hypothetical protein
LYDLVCDRCREAWGTSSPALESTLSDSSSAASAALLADCSAADLPLDALAAGEPADLAGSAGLL